jgi:hypothetical protein
MCDDPLMTPLREPVECRHRVLIHTTFRRPAGAPAITTIIEQQDSGTSGKNVLGRQHTVSDIPGISVQVQCDQSGARLIEKPAVEAIANENIGGTHSRPNGPVAGRVLYRKINGPARGNNEQKVQNDEDREPSQPAVHFAHSGEWTSPSA